MQKVLVLFTLLLLAVSTGQAQQIEIKKVLGSQQYLQDGKVLRMKDFVNQLESNPEAFEYAKKTKSNASAANTLAFIGGALIGWPLGTALGGGEPNWALAGIGAGVIVVAIPLNSGANKNGTKAVELYNAGLSSTSYFTRPELKIGSMSSGLGLSLSF